jgi:hypothetical protein
MKPLLIKREQGGIEYRTRAGMVKSIRTPKGWRNVWNSGGISEAVRALIEEKSPWELFEIIYRKGNQI